MSSLPKDEGKKLLNVVKIYENEVLDILSHADMEVERCKSDAKAKINDRTKLLVQFMALAFIMVVLNFWLFYSNSISIRVIFLSFFNIPRPAATNQILSPEARHYQDFASKILNETFITEKFISEIVDYSPFPSTSVEFSEINEDESIAFPRIPSISQCDEVPVNFRFDCFPSGISSQSSCLERGCCWREVHIDRKGNEAGALNVPYCYYPSSYALYNATELKYKTHGIHGTLKRHSKSGFPLDIDTLKLEISFETCSRIRIRIFDRNHPRWETPLPPIPISIPNCVGNRLYNVDIVEQNGNIIISRNDSGLPLFDMRKAAPFIFSDQYIQISTLLPSSYIYGLGQHLDGLLLDTLWRRRVLWNVDGAPNPEWNLYGSHPFYMVMEHTGSAHGVFLLNSNAIEVILQPTPALTFRTIGGIIDMYVFLGPSPDEVISQYTEIIGRPFIPPYWSLGYHQCRFGYKNLTNLKKIWKRTRDAGIPFDVQWSDIDYMRNQNDFTIDEDAYAGLPQFVDELHKVGMHYVIITDPGISGGEEPGKYFPFDIGVKDNVFVKNSTDQLFIGKVWNPKATVFPDFTSLNAVIYWSFLIMNFRNQLKFDGLWIDMNEPSNFWDGQINGCPTNSTLEHPYYIPFVIGGKLYFKTLCMTAKHYIGNHYNVHNLYGFTEAISTYASLKMIPDIGDPFIISRSTFPGIGSYAGHWTGDIHSDWFNLWKSIGAVLTMNIHGIPMVGADICGFNGNTTAALCNRWMQLGAFYPFSRNHNTDDGIDQDPVAMGELVVQSSRKALLQRYTLLPFLFTLFVKAHETGVPVAKPLFFKFYYDKETYGIDTQFMWGDELMIIPVLTENATSVIAYFPIGKWYDWYTGRVVSKKGREYLTIDAPLDTIPLVVSEGSILPCQNPGNTTTQSRLNAFGLVVALSSEQTALGELHWNKPGESGHAHWKFRASPNYLYSTPLVEGVKDEYLKLDWIKIFGISSTVFEVNVNGLIVPFSYSAVKQVLLVKNLSLNFKESLTLHYV